MPHQKPSRRKVLKLGVAATVAATTGGALGLLAGRGILRRGARRFQERMLNSRAEAAVDTARRASQAYFKSKVVPELKAGNMRFPVLIGLRAFRPELEPELEREFETAFKQYAQGGQLFQDRSRYFFEDYSFSELMALSSRQRVPELLKLKQAFFMYTLHGRGIRAFGTINDRVPQKPIVGVQFSWTDNAGEYQKWYKETYGLLSHFEPGKISPSAKR